MVDIVDISPQMSSDSEASKSASSNSPKSPPPSRTAYGRLKPTHVQIGHTAAGRKLGYFDKVINGDVEIRSAEQAHAFLDTILIQQDPIGLHLQTQTRQPRKPKHPREQTPVHRCIESLVTKPGGLSALKSTFNQTYNVDWLDRHVCQFLLFVSHRMVPGSRCDQDVAYNSLARKVIQTLTERDDLWIALSEAFKEDELGPSSQEAYAWLLTELLDIDEQVQPAHFAMARDPEIWQKLITSSIPQIRLFGKHIGHFIATTEVASLSQYAKGVRGPGGRHDNDFVDFRQIQITPTPDEIHCTEEPFLIPVNNLDDAPIEVRVGAHLDNQFRILREDLLQNVRKDYDIVINHRNVKNHHGERQRTILEGLHLQGMDHDSINFKRRFGLKFEYPKGFPEFHTLSKKDAHELMAMNSTFPFKHCSLGCLVIEDEIVAFPTLYREVPLLLQNPPVLILQIEDSTGLENTLTKLLKLKGNDVNITLICVDTPLFAYEPILERLQLMKRLPLTDQLLLFKKGSSIPETSFKPVNAIRRIRPGADLDKTFRLTVEAILDKAQANALISALKHKVSLIQGPPGTGKTFIGAILTRLLLDYTDERILVITQQNQSCDDFIENILEIGINPENVVRLGSQYTKRTRQTSIQERIDRMGILTSVKNVLTRLREACELWHYLIEEYWKIFWERPVSLESLMKEIKLFKHDQEFDFVKAFRLPREWSKELKASGGTVPDENYLLKHWIDGGTIKMKMAKNMSIKATNVWKMPMNSRQDLIDLWKEEATEQNIKEVVYATSEYNKVHKEISDWLDTRTQMVISQRRIIVCTSNSAARHFKNIEAAAPKIIIVEEAGQILESHILTALHSSVEQLIMIRDHMQLRPKCDTFKLCTESGYGYNLNMSLFERLIGKGFPYITLENQYRMRPEISDTIRTLTYPNLKDAPSTKRHPDLLGLCDNVIWIQHSESEAPAELVAIPNITNKYNSCSKRNYHEADMVVQIVKYLAQQGYGAENMVVLTPYLGQASLITDWIAQHADSCDPVLSNLDYHDLVRAGLMQPRDASLLAHPLDISTIDNYQGEEREIVIVSLVRSNNENKIGFMSSPERLNVLLSRARDGLIIIGNPITFACAEPGGEVWQDLYMHLHKSGHIYDGLPVYCLRHPTRRTTLKCAEDFKRKCPEGGCEYQCEAMLACKVHQCPFYCHRLEDHTSMGCDKQVVRECEFGHLYRDSCIPLDPTMCPKCFEIKERHRKSEEAEAVEAAKFHAEQLAKEQAILRNMEKQNRADSLAQARQEELDQWRKIRRIAEGLDESPVQTEAKRRDQKRKYSKARLDASASGRPLSDVDEETTDDVEEPIIIDKCKGQRHEQILQPAVFGDTYDAVDDLEFMEGLQAGAEAEIGVANVLQALDKERDKVDNDLELAYSSSSSPSDTFSHSSFGLIVDGSTVAEVIVDGSVVAEANLDGAYLSTEGIQTGSEQQKSSFIACKSSSMEGFCTMLTQALDTPFSGVEVAHTKEPGVLSVGEGDSRPVKGLLVANQISSLETTHVDIAPMDTTLLLPLPNGNNSTEIRSEVGEAFDPITPQSQSTSREAAQLNPETFVLKHMRPVGIDARSVPHKFHSRARDDWEQHKRDTSDSNTAIDQIMDMIGLEHVKEQILRIKAKADTVIRQGTNLQDERFHIALLGNPGTGKTTVARLYAKFLRAEGILRCSYSVDTTGSVLASEGVLGIQALFGEILQAGGGSLFIDEAYQLVTTGTTESRQVLDILLSEMERHLGRVVVVLSGYNKEMELFFEHNPSLISRIPYRIKLDDFSDEQLLYLMQNLIGKKFKGQMEIEDGFTGLYMRIVARRIGRTRGLRGCGNARAIENALAKILERQAARLTRERKGGKAQNDFLLTCEDLIGPPPTKAAMQSLAWKELDQLIGLKAVKESVATLLKRMELNYQRELAEEKPIELSLNRVFLGSPGTGKTSVAKIYGQILADLGLLSNGEVITKSPSDFIGRALGESEGNTKAILQAALGKVLIIDEAYMFTPKMNGGEDPFKTAVIDTIVSEVQNVPGDDQCVLLLGYKDDLEKMFRQVNPGLTRRFALSDGFVFEDFTDDELTQILDLKLRLSELSATKQARLVAIEKLSQQRQNPNFGNAGEVENLLSRAKERMLKRHVDGDASMELLPEDFDPNFDRSLRADINLRELFNGLHGIDEVISRLSGHQRTALAMRSRGLDPHKNTPMLYIFKGPPGTGKTTTARKMGQIFYDMGLLSTNEVVECSASDLTAEYLGQTAQKTRKKLESALGKVLFIDEAYRLLGNAYGTEAVDELVDGVTKPSFAEKIVVILAGYDEGMDKLLNANIGLASRFSEVVHFDQVGAEAAMKIIRAEVMKSCVGIPYLDEAHVQSLEQIHVAELMRELVEMPGWGNARDAMTLAKNMVSAVFTSIQGDEELVVSYEIIVDTIKDMLKQRQRNNVTTTKDILTDIRVALNGTAQTVAFGRDRTTETKASVAPAIPEVNTIIRSAAGTVEADETVTLNLEAVAKIGLPQDEDSQLDGAGSDDSYTITAPATTGNVDQANDILPKLVANHDTSSAIYARREELQTELEALRNLSNQVADEVLRVENMRSADAHDYEWRLKEVKVFDEQTAEAITNIEKDLLNLEEQERLAAAKEKLIQQKLNLTGACPKGYHWFREDAGWRCCGGEHFVSHEMLAAFDAGL